MYSNICVTHEIIALKGICRILHGGRYRTGTVAEIKEQVKSPNYASTIRGDEIRQIRRESILVGEGLIDRAVGEAMMADHSLIAKLYTGELPPAKDHG